MSFATSFQRYVSNFRIQRRRRATRHLLDALPPEIQKDIGWRGFAPDTDRYRAGNRR